MGIFATIGSQGRARRGDGGRRTDRDVRGLMLPARFEAVGERLAVGARRDQRVRGWWAGRPPVTVPTWVRHWTG